MNTLLRQFFTAPVSLAFWAFGWAYTIVRFRHIGIDIATTGDVPALRVGKVVRVVRTTTMAWVVVLRWGLLYFAYCHLAKTTHLPKVGDRVRKGEIIGRLAWTDYPQNPGYGGSLWNGPHLHLVVSTHPEAAYRKVAGAVYLDPAPLIRDTLTIPDPRIARVTTRATRLFAAPAKDAPGLKNLPKDTRVVTVGSAVGGFLRVKYSDAVAYILASRLVTQKARVHTPGSDLRYRSRPSTVTGKILGALPHGTVVTILGVDGSTSSAKWARVTVGGREVWVARKFLR
ncbi:SH3 domain-containing protein [Microbacterium sp. PA5]|uniref:SH3 domain-containing protein n=1 Tax=Microbacterium sp. PA5 TaxID=3416654 RepID=UPI003CF47BE8